MKDFERVPAGGFTPSASGGLHASSVGEDYPWTVQPRLNGSERLWVAFNAHTGYETAAYQEYFQAEAWMRHLIADEKRQAAKLAKQRERAKLTIAAQKGRTLPDVRR